MLRRWLPQLFAVLTALMLGLLNPLSCVIHCYVQEVMAQRAALAFFLCDEHGLMALPAQPAPVAAHHQHHSQNQRSDVPTPTPPRALYELQALPLIILVVTFLPLTVLPLAPSRQRLALPQIPPTPPPRLSLA